MFSDDFDENDDLIKGSSESIIKDRKSGSKWTLSNSLFKCVVIGLLLMTLFIMLAAFGWFYLSVYLQSVESVPKPIVSLSSIQSLKTITDYLPGFALSILPNRTIETLWSHDSDSNVVTEEEEAILRKIFQLADSDKDNHLNFNEFTTFIDVAIEPQTNFEKIDIDKNGVVSLKEIALFIKEFDSTDLYECSETDEILSEIFGFDSTDSASNRELFSEYVGHLWLHQLDKEKIGVISKADYVKYIESEEWKYHDHNNNDLVDFTEFKNSFFISTYYRSWKKGMDLIVNDEDAVENVYTQLDAMNANTVTALELQTTPHEFWGTINAYINREIISGNAHNPHGPSQSLLYAFPNIYFAQNLIDPNKRRRMTSRQEYDPANPCAHPCYEASMMTLYCYNVTMVSCHGQCQLGCTKTTDACISGEMKTFVKTADGAVSAMLLKEISTGDYVFDGTEFTKVIVVERGDVALEMMTLYLNETEITLTADHMVYDVENELITAGKLSIGDTLYNGFVINKIEYNVYHAPSTPLTVSGMIEVNGMKASCFPFTKKFAESAMKILLPFHWLQENVNAYYSTLILEQWMGDVVDMYLMVFGEHRYNLVAIFDIHWVIDLTVVFMGFLALVGKELIAFIVSIFM